MSRRIEELSTEELRDRRRRLLIALGEVAAEEYRRELERQGRIASDLATPREGHASPG